MPDFMLQGSSTTLRLPSGMSASVLRRKERSLDVYLARRK